MAEQEHERLRALVKYDPKVAASQTRKPRRDRKKIARIGGIVLAAIIVVLSMAIVVSLLLSELSGSDSSSEVVTQSATPADSEDATEATDDAEPEPTAPPATPVPTPSSVTPADGFDELRFLPAGSVEGMSLQSLVRWPDTAPLASFTRTTDEGLLTGIVMVDLTDQVFADKVGVTAPTELRVDDQTALLTGIGPLLTYVVSWDDPTLGSVRASTLGVPELQIEPLLNDVIATVFDSEAALPDGWLAVEDYQANEPSDTWRAYFLGLDGEVALVSTTRSPGPSAKCAEQSDGCPSITSLIDEDDVERTTIASPERLATLSEQMRPVSRNNAAIRSREFEPLTEIGVERVRPILFIPNETSEWQVTDVFAHTSGNGVSEPTLVAVERETPQIGEITSAIVVRLSPLGSLELGSESLSAGRSRLVVDKGDVLIEIAGWNHTLEELQLVADLITIGDLGVEFASRAGTAVGLERRYELLYDSPVPRTFLEGAVFGATVANDFGAPSNIRVSTVPGYAPQEVAVVPRDNDLIEITLRGQTASLVVADGVATLTWEERPGVLITLTGADETELVQLAEALELVELDDLVGSE